MQKPNVPSDLPFRSSILALWEEWHPMFLDQKLKRTVKRWISEHKWQDLVYLMHTLKLIERFNYP